MAIENVSALHHFMAIVSDRVSEQVMMFLYFPLHGLAMSHACYNPIIYCFMNTRFRDGLFIILRTIPFLKKYFDSRAPSTRLPGTACFLRSPEIFVLSPHPIDPHSSPYFYALVAD
ncbi:hypothetical protein NQ317_015128 [Molorchus minor]|uniref:G-protein coupled receptors family 1 profile domain-containing protein n=1 Tax=Molorchus minor TaxID=1323400 RepID=A0ABQ9K6H7_9CUCU|nr:hypothetical protein NQ317_015128 [Molorchus minor]